MSRHYFTTSHLGFPTTLYLGWDRPMQYFFLVIEKPEEPIEEDTCDEHDIYLYSNLQERDPLAMAWVTTVPCCCIFRSPCPRACSAKFCVMPKTMSATV